MKPIQIFICVLCFLAGYVSHIFYQDAYQNLIFGVSGEVPEKVALDAMETISPVYKEVVERKTFPKTEVDKSIFKIKTENKICVIEVVNKKPANKVPAYQVSTITCTDTSK